MFLPLLVVVGLLDELGWYFLGVVLFFEGVDVVEVEGSEVGVPHDSND